MVMAQNDKKKDRRSRPVEEWSDARKAALANFVKSYSGGKAVTKRVSDKDVAKILLDTGGCINRAAISLGYSTPWLHHRIKSSTELTEVLTQARSATVHAVSEGLIEAALKVKDDPRYFQCAKLVLELYGAPHGVHVGGDVTVQHFGHVEHKIDTDQVDAFKAALERAVLAQKSQEDEVIDVE